MLKIEKFVTPSPEQWKIVIDGMRNPMNSWEKSDSKFYEDADFDPDDYIGQGMFLLGPHDYALMKKLRDGGPVHAKYRRMLPVYVTITAPLYWWKEFETYRTGVAPNPLDIEMNSCSTMHKIHAEEFTLEDFSIEHLHKRSSMFFDEIIDLLNYWRDIYLDGGMVDNYDGKARVYEKKDKDAWWQMIQLLPSSYNQKRTVMLNYETLANIYKWRKDHKLDEWRTFCHWIEELPYSELITGYEEE